MRQTRLAGLLLSAGVATSLVGPVSRTGDVAVAPARQYETARMICGRTPANRPENSSLTCRRLAPHGRRRSRLARQRHYAPDCRLANTAKNRRSGSSTPTSIHVRRPGPRQCPGTPKSPTSRLPETILPPRPRRLRVSVRHCENQRRLIAMACHAWSYAPGKAHRTMLKTPCSSPRAFATAARPSAAPLQGPDAAPSNRSRTSAASHLRRSRRAPPRGPAPTSVNTPAPANNPPRRLPVRRPPRAGFPFPIAHASPAPRA